MINYFNKLTEVQRIKLINYMKNGTQIDEKKELKEIVSWSVNSYLASKDLSDYLQDKGWYVDYSSTLEECKYYKKIDLNEESSEYIY